ncbi:MAG: SRPBCC domain-containing protein [Polyangiaceae bacterium]
MVDPANYLRIERTYSAPVEDLWELWTTKEGFEAWWGPQGFRVEVFEIDVRVGGELRYDMIAAGEQEIAAMKAAGMDVKHYTHGVFTEVEHLRLLTCRYDIDFLPGVKTYTNDVRVEFTQEGDQVRMLVLVQRHVTDEISEGALQGFTSQLTKLPDALAARAKRQA